MNAAEPSEGLPAVTAALPVPAHPSTRVAAPHRDAAAAELRRHPRVFQARQLHSSRTHISPDHKHKASLEKPTAAVITHRPFAELVKCDLHEGISCSAEQPDATGTGVSDAVWITGQSKVCAKGEAENSWEEPPLALLPAPATPALGAQLCCPENNPNNTGRSQFCPLRPLAPSCSLSAISCAQQQHLITAHGDAERKRQNRGRLSG